MEKQIPNLERSNKYLFQSEKGGHIKEKQLLRRLQSLQKKAGVDSKGKVFGWHLGRKLFLRTCAELGITSWNAQMMCGKAVDKSIAAYINGVKLKGDAMKVHDVLKMEVVNGMNNHGRIEQLENALKQVESENLTFKTRIDLLQKDVQSLKKSMEGLWHMPTIYPTTVTHRLLNKKTGKMEQWNEIINTPEEMEEVLKAITEFRL